MTEYLLAITIFMSGNGIEKIRTAGEIVYHDQASGVLHIIHTPHSEDISPISVSAGEDISTCVGSHISLSAAKTHDPLSSQLSYRWFFYSKPIGSSAFLWYSDGMNPEFVVDIPGEYFVTLEVKADDGRTGADTVLIKAEDCKGYPRAVITTAKTVVRPGEITLSAQSSTSVNDEIVSYEWGLVSRPAGSKATITGSVEAYLVLDQIGVYRVSLTVRTRKGYSDSQTIELRCIDGEIPPVYAFSQELILNGAMARQKKLAVLIEFPNGMKDLTGVAVYGKTGERVELLTSMKLSENESVYRKVVDWYENVYVVGKIHEKMVLVKHCDRY